MADLDHATLVARAALWLRKTERCSLVLTDRGHADERADAIGWPRFGEPSILVEVKASRADFLRDREKQCRRDPGSGLGCYRWYLAPAGLIKLSELPPWWGLLEPRPFEHPREFMATPLVRRFKAARAPANEQAELKCIFYQCADTASRLRTSEHRLQYAQRSEKQLASEVERLTAENARMAQRIIDLQGATLPATEDERARRDRAQLRRLAP